MEGAASEAFKALGLFPIVQVGVAFVIVFLGYTFMQKGMKDGDKRSDGLPGWVPLHDMVQSIRSIEEQERTQTELMRRMEGTMSDLLREMVNVRGVLELIRNESRLR